MGENSKISWTEHTWNPWIGCTKVSPGCANCYAEEQNKLRQWNKNGWGPGAPRKRTSEANWRKPIGWNKVAMNNLKTGGGRRRVFCASLADWLDDEVPPRWQNDLLELIGRTPYLDWLLLTKRPENWEGVMTNAILAGVDVAHDWVNDRPPRNVWIGASAEDQERANERLPLLMEIPARVRFLSCEPLLGPVDLFAACFNTEDPEFDDDDTEPVEFGKNHHGLRFGVDWVICGGESGGAKSRREMEPEWAYSLRGQCADAGVAFYFKQFSGRWPAKVPPELDGVRHVEFPEVRA